jgi:hypothetical protein
MKKILFSFGHGLGTVSFLSLLFLTFFWPQALPALHLTPELARIVMLQILSFIFLLAYLQFYFSLTWRIFALLACFFSLGQSVWMSFISLGVK